MTGLLIAIEGCDGAGKTEQARRLTAAIYDHGRGVNLTREPSDGYVGRLIREALRGAPISRAALGHLYAADRIDHVEKEIAPALARGEIVVTDRYETSNRAYRVAEAKGDMIECVGCHRVLHEPAHCPFIHPVLRLSAAAERALIAVTSLTKGLVPRADLTVVLDVSEETARARMKKRSTTELFDGAEMQARVRQLYRHAELLHGDVYPPGAGVVIVDGNGTEDDVATRVWALVQPLISNAPAGAGGAS